MNSQIILASQGGRRRSEERCIVLIDTDQTKPYDVKKEKGII